MKLFLFLCMFVFICSANDFDSFKSQSSQEFKTYKKSSLDKVKFYQPQSSVQNRSNSTQKTQKAKVENLQTYTSAQGKNSPKNVITYYKYKNKLKKEELTSNKKVAFKADGKLNSNNIKNSEQVIKAKDLNNKKLQSYLKKQKGKLKDWGKHSTKVGKDNVHFYKNTKTGQVSYKHDYKTVINDKAKRSSKVPVSQEFKAREKQAQRGSMLNRAQKKVVRTLKAKDKKTMLENFKRKIKQSTLTKVKEFKKEIRRVKQNKNAKRLDFAKQQSVKGEGKRGFFNKQVVRHNQRIGNNKVRVNRKAITRKQTKKNTKSEARRQAQYSQQWKAKRQVKYRQQQKAKQQAKYRQQQKAKQQAKYRKQQKAKKLAAKRRRQQELRRKKELRRKALARRNAQRRRQRR